MHLIDKMNKEMRSADYDFGNAAFHNSPFSYALRMFMLDYLPLLATPTI